jgi:hypothetical protein
VIVEPNAFRWKLTTYFPFIVRSILDYLKICLEAKIESLHVFI